MVDVTEFEMTVREPSKAVAPVLMAFNVSVRTDTQSDDRKDRQEFYPTRNHYSLSGLLGLADEMQCGEHQQFLPAGCSFSIVKYAPTCSRKFANGMINGPGTGAP